MFKHITKSIDMNMNVFVRTVRRREIKSWWYVVGVSREVESSACNCLQKRLMSKQEEKQDVLTRKESRGQQRILRPEAVDWQ